MRNLCCNSDIFLLGLLDCLNDDYDIGHVNIAEVMASVNTAAGVTRFLVKLSKIAPFIAQWKQIFNGGAELELLPLNSADINQLASEIKIIRNLIKLPLFNTMSVNEMEQLSFLSGGCLILSLSCVSAEPSDILTSIVADTIHICQIVVKISKISTRLSAAMEMNLTCFSTWLIISGVKKLLASNPNLTCNQMLVTVASHALAGLEVLKGDLGGDGDHDDKKIFDTVIGT